MSEARAQVNLGSLEAWGSDPQSFLSRLPWQFALIKMSGLFGAIFFP